MFHRYSPSVQNVQNGLLKKYFMDLFKNTNSYMTEKVPDITLSPEFEQYFTLFTFSLTANTKQSAEFLPICSSGRVWVSFYQKW